MHFLDILGIFRLEIGQISFDRVKKAFTTWQLAFLATGTTFCDILARAYAEIKILRWFLDGKVTYIFRRFDFFNSFLAFPSISFLFRLAAVIDLLLSLPALKNCQESTIEMNIFFHGEAMCSGRKFSSAFFSQLFEHFSVGCLFSAFARSEIFQIRSGSQAISCRRQWVYLLYFL